MQGLWIAISSLTLSTINSPSSPAIIAGTSLSLGEVRNLIYYAGHVRQRNKYQVKTSLGTVETSESFWDLFEDHFWNLVDEITQQQPATAHASALSMPLLSRAGRTLDFEVNLSDEEHQELERLRRLADPAEPDMPNLYQDISKECSHFFGRYRWSTLLIEQLLKEAIKAIKDSGHVSQLSVSEAVKSTVKSVTEALSSQLERIKNKPWIEDLYWMAIRADVYSQSSIMEDETANLVSEGFAIVKISDQVNHQKPKTKPKPKPKPNLPNDIVNVGKYVRVMVCEPLTVNAVMKHLRTSGNYEKMMDKFFSLLQVDNIGQSSIGKIAEYVLASVSAPFRCVGCHGTNNGYFHFRSWKISWESPMIPLVLIAAIFSLRFSKKQKELNLDQVSMMIGGSIIRQTIATSTFTKQNTLRRTSKPSVLLNQPALKNGLSWRGSQLIRRFSSLRGRRVQTLF